MVMGIRTEGDSNVAQTEAAAKPFVRPVAKPASVAARAKDTPVRSAATREVP